MEDLFLHFINVFPSEMNLFETSVKGLFIYLNLGLSYHGRNV